MPLMAICVSWGGVGGEHEPGRAPLVRECGCDEGRGLQAQGAVRSSVELGTAQVPEFKGKGGQLGWVA